MESNTRGLPGHDGPEQDLAGAMADGTDFLTEPPAPPPTIPVHRVRPPVLRGDRPAVVAAVPALNTDRRAERLTISR